MQLMPGGSAAAAAHTTVTDWPACFASLLLLVLLGALITLVLRPSRHGWAKLTTRPHLASLAAPAVQADAVQAEAKTEGTPCLLEQHEESHSAKETSTSTAAACTGAANVSSELTADPAARDDSPRLSRRSSARNAPAAAIAALGAQEPLSTGTSLLQHSALTSLVADEGLEGPVSGGPSTLTISSVATPDDRSAEYPALCFTEPPTIPAHGAAAPDTTNKPVSAGRGAVGTDFVGTPLPHHMVGGQAMAAQCTLEAQGAASRVSDSAPGAHELHRTQHEQQQQQQQHELAPAEFPVAAKPATPDAAVMPWPSLAGEQGWLHLPLDSPHPTAAAAATGKAAPHPAATNTAQAASPPAGSLLPGGLQLARSQLQWPPAQGAGTGRGGPATALPAYRPVLSQVLLRVKLPHAEPEQLPQAALAAVGAVLQPRWHLTGVAVSRGCVDLELRLTQAAEQESPQEPSRPPRTSFTFGHDQSAEAAAAGTGRRTPTLIPSSPPSGAAERAPGFAVGAAASTGHAGDQQAASSLDGHERRSSSYNRAGEASTQPAVQAVLQQELGQGAAAAVLSALHASGLHHPPAQAIVTLQAGAAVAEVVWAGCSSRGDVGTGPSVEQPGQWLVPDAQQPGSGQLCTPAPALVAAVHPPCMALPQQLPHAGSTSRRQAQHVVDVTLHLRAARSGLPTSKEGAGAGASNSSSNSSSEASTWGWPTNWGPAPTITAKLSGQAVEVVGFRATTLEPDSCEVVALVGLDPAVLHPVVPGLLTVLLSQGHVTAARAEVLMLAPHQSAMLQELVPAGSTATAAGQLEAAAAAATMASGSLYADLAALLQLGAWGGQGGESALPPGVQQSLSVPAYQGLVAKAGVHLLLFAVEQRWPHTAAAVLQVLVGPVLRLPAPPTGHPLSQLLHQQASPQAPQEAAAALELPAAAATVMPSSEACSPTKHGPPAAAAADTARSGKQQPGMTSPDEAACSSATKGAGDAAAAVPSTAGAASSAGLWQAALRAVLAGGFRDRRVAVAAADNAGSSSTTPAQTAATLPNVSEDQYQAWLLNTTRSLVLSHSLVGFAGIGAASVRAYVDMGKVFPWNLVMLGIIWMSPYCALALYCSGARGPWRAQPLASGGVNASNWLRPLFLAAAVGRNLVHFCYAWHPPLMPPNMAGMVRSGVDVTLDATSALLELVGMPWLLLVQVGTALVQWRLYGAMGMGASSAFWRAAGKCLFNVCCAIAVEACWRRSFLVRKLRELHHS